MNGNLGKRKAPCGAFLELLSMLVVPATPPSGNSSINNSLYLEYTTLNVKHASKVKVIHNG